MDPAAMPADDSSDPAGSTTDDTSDPAAMDDPAAGAGDPAASAGDDMQPDNAPGDVTTTTDPSVAGDDTPSAPCGRFGMTVVVNQTIVVAAGETYDGGCQRYVAGNGLIANAAAAQTDQPLFRLEAGARLQNAVLDASASDGIHTYGDATVSNVALLNISDDALTIKAAGTVEVQGGSANNAQDAVFQINAPSTLHISGFTARDAGKLIRQNGGTTFRVDVVIDQCVISGMSEAIFRTDSAQSRVTMTNTRYTSVGGDPFMGVAPRNITLSGNSAY